MEDIRKFKVVFIDFDDTICLHKKPIDYASSDVLFEPPEVAASKWFADSFLNIPLYDMMLSSGKKKAILLTQSGNTQLEAKKVWLANNAPQIDFVFKSVSTDCPKYKYIESFCKKFGFGYEDCLLIDDEPEIVKDIDRRRICTARLPSYYFPEQAPKTEAGSMTQENDTVTQTNFAKPRRIVLHDENIISLKEPLITNPAIIPTGEFFVLGCYYWKDGAVEQRLFLNKTTGMVDALDNASKAIRFSTALAKNNCKNSCEDGAILCALVVKVKHIAGQMPLAKIGLYICADGVVTEQEVRRRAEVLVSMKGIN